MKKEIEIDLNSPNATSNGAMEKQVDALLIDGLNDALGTNKYSLENPPPDESLRSMADDYILRREYEQTKNPFFAWAAYRSWTKIGFSPPDWVQTYLAETAERMHDFDYSPRSVLGAFANTLGVEKATQYRQYREFSRRREIARFVEKEIADNWIDIGRQPKLDIVYEAIAVETGYSKSTVRTFHIEWYERYGSQFDKLSRKS